MKEFFENIIAVVVTMLIVACVGIGLPTTLAVLIAFVFIRHLLGTVVDHVKDKKMPAVMQWVQYGLEFVTLILVICGVNYTSLWCLIVGLITAAGALVCSILYSKKIVKEVE